VISYDPVLTYQVNISVGTTTTTTITTSTTTIPEGCLNGNGNCDGTVSDSELLDCIGQWVGGDVTGVGLLEAIGNWLL